VPRVVLDNCVPRTLLAHLGVPGATTVGALGWADVDDGPLLDLLAGACDVFVTVDRNLPFQQRLETRPFATVLLLARANRVADLVPLVPELRVVIARTRPGEVTRVARERDVAADRPWGASGCAAATLVAQSNASRPRTQSRQLNLGVRLPHASRTA
jgi:hypothetical protein